MRTMLPLILAAAFAGCASAHEILVCSYFTPAGRTIPSPTLERPAFCSLVPSSAYRTDAIQDPEPATADTMHRLMTRAIHINHYQEASAGMEKPNLIVVYHWGQITPIIVNAGTLEEHFVNRTEMLGIMIGRASPEVNASERTQLLIAAREERFFGIVSAYDADDWRRTGKRTLLWRTHMSMPSHRLSENQAMALLLAGGAALFGRDSLGEKTIAINATALREIFP